MKIIRTAQGQICEYRSARNLLNCRECRLHWKDSQDTFLLRLVQTYGMHLTPMRTSNSAL